MPAETSGSAYSHPVSQITAAAAMTPTDEIASGQDLEVGALQIEAFLGRRTEQPNASSVDTQSDKRNEQHRTAGDRLSCG